MPENVTVHLSTLERRKVNVCFSVRTLGPIGLVF